MKSKLAVGLAVAVAAAAFLTPNIATAKDYGVLMRVNAYPCVGSNAIGYNGDMTLGGYYTEKEGKAHIAQMLRNNGFKNAYYYPKNEYTTLTIKKTGSGLLIDLFHHDERIRRDVFKFTLERPQKSYEDLSRLEALMPRSCTPYRGTPEQTDVKATDSSGIIERAAALYSESAEKRKERLLVQANIAFDKDVVPNDVYFLVTEGMPQPAPRYRMGMIPNPWRTPEKDAAEFVEDKEYDDAGVVEWIRRLDENKDSRISLEEMIHALEDEKVQKNFKFPGPKMLVRYQKLRTKIEK